jgi:hypothetical protein
MAILDGSGIWSAKGTAFGSRCVSATTARGSFWLFALVGRVGGDLRRRDQGEEHVGVIAEERVGSIRTRKRGHVHGPRSGAKAGGGDMRSLKTRFSNVRACLDLRNNVNRIDSQRRSESRTVVPKCLRQQANVVPLPRVKVTTTASATFGPSTRFQRRKRVGRW